jgi:hypothetical protein
MILKIVHEVRAIYKYVGEWMKVINSRFIMKSGTDYRLAIYILPNSCKSVRRYGRSCLIQGVYWISETREANRLITIIPIFRRVRKIAESDCYLRHVHPSGMEQLGSYWTDFHEI